jgi:hypothetical protein
MNARTAARPFVRWWWLAPMVVALVCGALYRVSRATRPVRIAIVRNADTRDLDSERAVREFVAALRDDVARLAGTLPGSVALVPPWQAVCEGTRVGPCAPRALANAADVYLVVSTPSVRGRDLELRVAFVWPGSSRRDLITFPLPGDPPWHWPPFVRRTIDRLALNVDPADADEEPGDADEGIRLLRAALSGTTVELTKPDLDAISPVGWMAWLRAPQPGIAPRDLRAFLDEYAAAWTSRTSGRVRALHTTMSSGERSDIERYFDFATELDVAFSDVEVRAQGEQALVSAWRVDRGTTAAGAPLGFRTRVDLLLRRLAGGWMVVDQSRPRALVWGPATRRSAVAEWWRPPPSPVAPPPAATFVPTAGDTRWKSLPRWAVSPVDDQPLRQRGLTVPEVEALASNGDASRFRTETSAPWVLLDEQPGLDDRDLTTRLRGVYEDVTRDFPFLLKPQNPAVLIIFASKERNQRFWDVLYAKLGLRPGELPAGYRGQATLGIGTTWWSDDVPESFLTRVCVHEAVHALMEQMLDVGVRTESWFAEGLASRYDLKAVDFDVGTAVQDSMREGSFPSVQELMTAQRIPHHGYIPAALLIEWFLADPLRRSQLPVLYRELHAAPSHALAPLLERNFGMSIARLDQQWRAWVADRYGGTP